MILINKKQLLQWKADWFNPHQGKLDGVIWECIKKDVIEFETDVIEFETPVYVFTFNLIFNKNKSNKQLNWYSYNSDPEHAANLIIKNKCY